MVVIGRMWFYSGKSGCIRAKVVVFGPSGCIRAKMGCIRVKWLYFDKVVVFVQKLL